MNNRIQLCKSLLMFFIIAVLLQSCNAEDLLQNKPEAIQAKSHNSCMRSIEEAVDIATQATEMLPGHFSRNERTINVDSIKFYLKNQSRNNDIDTLMYIINFEDNAGFALIAANKAVPGGLLAITESGNYNPNIECENPGLQTFVNMSEYYLSNLSDNNLGFIPDTVAIKIPFDPGTPGFMDYKIVRDTTYSVRINPNFNLQWGQDFPEGLLCPNGVAGCTNTATLMAMSYFESPKTITLTYDANPSTISIDWKAIKRHSQSYSSFYQLSLDGCNSNVHTIMAQICRESGHRNNSIYSKNPNETGTYTRTVLKGTLESFGLHPSEFYIGFPENVLQTLTNSGILICSASALTFIIDGLDYLDIHTAEYTREYGRPWVCSNDHGITSYRYYHINWGWNGEGSGFFRSNVFDAAKPYKYDDPNKPASGDFSENFVYINVFK